MRFASTPTGAVCTSQMVSSSRRQGGGDSATTPPCPHPLEEITLEDDAELPRDQYVGARVPRIGKAARERVRTAYGEHERRNAFPGVHDDLPSLFESALTDESDGVSARLIWCLARPALRDIGLLQWVGGHALGDAAQAGQRAWQGGAEYAPDLARVLWGEARARVGPGWSAHWNARA